MNSLWRNRKTAVIRHWYVLLPDFQSSTREFYDALEQEVSNHQLPGLGLSHVEFSEGGPLSPKRHYLRMRRERLVFDICSAPFGQAWFFSCRFAEIPLRLRLWEVAFLVGLLVLLYGAYATLFGVIWGSITFGMSIVSALIILNNVVTMGLDGLDSVLLKTPVLGAFYEIFLRRNTYYREDTRLMYTDLIDQIVRGQIEEVAGSQDVASVEFKSNDSAPRIPFSEVLRQASQSVWRATKKS